MKLLLNAPAVARLLELDPEATVELARTSAAQIAQEIARRMTREAIEAHISNFIASEMIEGSWHKKVIAEKYRKMLLDTMNAMATEFINDVNSGSINIAIRQRVDEVMNAKNIEIESAMTKQADRILRERFAAMFEGKS